MDRANERVRRLSLVARTIENISIPTPEPRERRFDIVVAVIIWILSGSVHLAQLFVMSRNIESLSSRVQRGEYDHLVCILSECLVKHQATIHPALITLDHPRRLAADAFLVRSLVAQYVACQNKKGVSVPSGEAIDMYLRFWRLRPVADTMKPLLLRLTHHRNTRRKFGQMFRMEWMMEMGKHSIAPTLSQSESTVRVSAETQSP